MQYPSCIIPFGKASKELDPNLENYGQAGSCEYQFFFQSQIASPGRSKLTARPKTTDNPEETDQAPTAIQVFTPRMRDEACLQAGKLIDEILNAS
jgi:hypothetical protein